MRLITGVLCIFVSASFAHAQAPTKRHRVKAILGAEVDPAGFWADWMSEHFPIVAWPQEASDAFGADFKGEWNFVQKRDLHADEVPSALLIRGLDSPQAEDQLIVTELLIVKWGEGRWKELARLDSVNGLVLDGKKVLLSSAVPSGYQVVVIAETDVPAKKGEKRQYRLGIRFAARDRKGNALPGYTRIRYSTMRNSYEIRNPDSAE